jgi:carboxypeptidase family protein
MNRAKPLTRIVLLGLISIGIGMLNLLGKGGAGPDSATGHGARHNESVAPMVNDVRGKDAEASGSPKPSKRLKHLQVPFILNEGQVDERVKFYAIVSGSVVHVTSLGQIVYDLPKVVGNRGARGWSLKEELIGARIESIQGKEKTAATISYFVGNDSAKWRTNIPVFSLVTMGEVYKGVKLELKATGESVEKFFYVNPGGRPEEIKVRVSGAASLRTNGKGELEAVTGLGKVVFSKPKAYQMSEDLIKEVEVAYAVDGKSYGFRVGKYDPTQKLVIDPVIQTTYIGGTGDDNATAIAVSGDYVYVAGSSHSTNFPGTAGGAQLGQAGPSDGFVALLTSDLKTLIQATYLGGTGEELVSGIAVNGPRVFVAGSTTSTDFPKTSGGARPAAAGGQDGFVALLTSDLKTLTRVTYIGGTYDDQSAAIVAVTPSTVDAYSVFVAGFTTSPDLPGTTGGAKVASSDAILPDGSILGDSFVAAFSSDLTTLSQATYIGGSSIDEIRAMAILPGFVYVAGNTSSSDLPWTFGGALDTRQDSSPAEKDGFVAQLTSDLTTPLQATYLGGNSLDIAWAIAANVNAGVYVAGETYSANFPGTAGHFQPLKNGPSDGFVAHLSTNLQSLLQSSYLGGPATDRAQAIALGDSFNGLVVYVAGSTDTIGNFVYDGFVAVLRSDLGPSLGSYFGTTVLAGGGNDLASAIAAEIPPKSGFNVYAAGSTNSTNFVGTAGGARPINGGGSDGFVGKLVLVPDYSFAPVSPISVQPGGSGSATVTVNSLNGFTDENVKVGIFAQSNGGPLPLGLTVPGFVEDIGPTPANGSISLPLVVEVASFVTPSTYTLWLLGFPQTNVTHAAPVTVNVTATVGGLMAVFSTFGGQGCIDNSGVVNAFNAKLMVADQLFSQGRIQPSSNTLAALLYQLQGQTGRHIVSSCLVEGQNIAPGPVLIADVQDLLQRQAAGFTPNPIVGYVLNASNAALPDATVSILNSSNKAVATVTTDATGFYFFAQTSAFSVGANYTVKVTGLPKSYKASTPPSLKITWGGTSIKLNDFVLN